MEALNFFKFWKMSPSTTRNIIPPPEYDDDDSFFDLNLNASNYKLNQPQLIEINSSDSEEDEELSETRSPISFLRSPAKLPSFFMFRKKTAGDESPKRKMQRPKDAVSKYLRFMRVRVSRSSGEISSETSAGGRQGMRSPSMRIVCRRLGKSRSRATAQVVGVSPVAIGGGDAVVQSDGIQSAILHCKKSYNYSRDISPLSRSVSEPAICANPSRFSMEEKKRISI